MICKVNAFSLYHLLQAEYPQSSPVSEVGNKYPFLDPAAIVEDVSASPHNFARKLIYIGVL